MAAAPAINLQEKLVDLCRLTIFELRSEWRRLHRMSPPMRLSRDLLIRGILYKLQEKSHGRLSMTILRRLVRHGETNASELKRERTVPLVLKPGTRLVREWHGVTHTVLVHRNDFEWHGQRYRSLSKIASTITGAHWSGPRFFGLRIRSAMSRGNGVSTNAKT